MTEWGATPYSVVVDQRDLATTTADRGLEGTPTVPVTAPAARYSTRDRSHRATTGRRSARPARSSDSGPPRSGGHREPPVRGFSPALLRPSRRRERWIVRWPE